MVNRQERLAWRFLNTGKPTLAPLRLPFLESTQALRATDKQNSPVFAASFELDRHQGATSSLVRFHSRRRAARLQGTSTVAARASASRRLSPWTRAASRMRSHCPRRAFTKASPQL